MHHHCPASERRSLSWRIFKTVWRGIKNAFLLGGHQGRKVSWVLSLTLWAGYWVFTGKIRCVAYVCLLKMYLLIIPLDYISHDIPLPGYPSLPLKLHLYSLPPLCLVASFTHLPFPALLIEKPTTLEHQISTVPRASPPIAFRKAILCYNVSGAVDPSLYTPGLWSSV
jgi:hypothetical protein